MIERFNCPNFDLCVLPDKKRKKIDEAGAKEPVKLTPLERYIRGHTLEGEILEYVEKNLGLAPRKMYSVRRQNAIDNLKKSGVIEVERGLVHKISYDKLPDLLERTSGGKIAESIKQRQKGFKEEEILPIHNNEINKLLESGLLKKVKNNGEETRIVFSPQEPEKSKGDNGEQIIDKKGTTRPSEINEKQQDKKGNIDICPECGGKSVHDHAHGETNCGDCGLVLESNIIDRGAEWKSYDREQERKRARAERYSDGKMGSQVTGYNYSGDDATSSPIYESIRRVRDHDGMRGHFHQVVSEIGRRARMLGFPEEAQKKAKDLFRRNFNQVQPWLIKDRIYGPVLYSIAKETNIPEATKEKIKEKYHIVSLEEKIKNDCAKLNAGEEVEAKSLELLKQAKEKWEFIRQTESFGEAIIYIASQNCLNILNQRQVANIAGGIPSWIFNTEVYILAEKLGIREELKESLKEKKFQANKERGARNTELVLKTIEENPYATLEQIGELMGISSQTVSKALRQTGFRRDIGTKNEKILDDLYAGIDILKLPTKERDKLIQETVRDHRELTLAEIANRFGITTERVRQIALEIRVSRAYTESTSSYANDSIIDQLRNSYPLRDQSDSHTPALETDSNEKAIIHELSARRREMIDNLDRYITSYIASEDSRVLREKQMAVFVDIVNFLGRGNSEGYVEAPTGFGKTVIFSELINAIDQRALVVVPSKILVEQTYKRLKQFNPDLDVGRVYGEKKETGKKVTITTYNSLIKSNGGTNPQDIDLLVLDEAHQSLTGLRADTIGRFTNAVKLGFTATPEYSRDKRVKKLLNNQIHRITLKDGVETGLLSSFSVYLAETDVDLSRVRVSPSGDYDQKELDAAINIQSRNKSAVELYKQLIEKNPDLSKTIINCVSVKHALEVAQLFQEAGINTEAVYSKQDRKERENIIQKYRMGQLDVLTNVNILTEGFDDAQTALAINLRPTLSNVVAKQRGGRILRLDPLNLAKHAVIVDYLDMNEEKRNSQVTFAQVAEGAQIFNPIELDIRRYGGRSWYERKPIETKNKLPLQIEGLNVITNTKEVLRVVKELEIGNVRQQLDDVQPGDFLTTSANIIKTFEGRYENVSNTGREILEDLKKSNPDIFALRKNKNVITPVITDANQFIEEMQKRGFKLKTSLPQIDRENEIATAPRELRKIFIGNENRLKAAANQVIEKIRNENPELIVCKKNGPKTVTVVTDKDLFITEMKKRGFERKDGSIRDIQPTDFNIGINNLVNFFVGDNRKLLKAANDIAASLREERPELIAKRKTEGGYSNVVTDKDLFFKLMNEKGINSRNGIKSKNDNLIQETDFSTHYVDLTNFFIGNRIRLMKAAHDVITALSKEKPELIARRLHEKGRSVDIVTDRELFIKLMEEKGFKKRQNTSGDIFPDSLIQETDFSIHYVDLTNFFIGNRIRLMKAAHDIVATLSNEKPELIAKKQHEKGRNVDVVTDSKLFIKLMQEKGFKIRPKAPADIFP